MAARSVCGRVTLTSSNWTVCSGACTDFGVDSSKEKVDCEGDSWSPMVSGASRVSALTPAGLGKAAAAAGAAATTADDVEVDDGRDMLAFATESSWMACGMV